LGSVAVARRAWWVSGLLMVGLGLAIVQLVWLDQSHLLMPALATFTPTLTPEPIIPTRTATPAMTPTEPALPSASPAVALGSVATTGKSSVDSAAHLVAEPSHTVSPTPTVVIPRTTEEMRVMGTATPTCTPSPSLTKTIPPSPAVSQGKTSWQGRPRWCAGVALGDLPRFDVAPLRLGWYLDWQAQAELKGGGDASYARMVRLRAGELIPDAPALAIIASAHPGALWLIGNEPDVKWQDNTPPAEYARLYHRAYTAIKTADPQAQIAIGGVTQPSPLRLRYLDAVLAAYQQQYGGPMPVDVWNVHNFVLREERGSWGVDIPPGIPDDSGLLYEISDSGNLEAFTQQVVAFRRWMADRGFRDSPLVVSEYGIPMPEDYGFTPDVVAGFLISTFDYFLTATDSNLGFPADGNRLVQRWCWYSLADTVYPTGNLFDPTSGHITALGKAWAEYVRNR
jgi:hypothetical protein